jgi:hypothetical protein
MIPQVIMNNLPNPSDWRHEPSGPNSGETNFILRRVSDGLPIVVVCRSDKGRARASLGHLETENHGPWILPSYVYKCRETTEKETDGEISVKSDTPSEVFARHIVRRLLPHAERVWPLMLAEAAERRANLDKQAAAVQTLEGVGCRFNVRTFGTKGPGSFPAGMSGTTIRVGETGRVRVEYMEVSLAQTLAVIAALKTVPAVSR